MRGINVSQVVDLFELEFREFSNAVGYSVDVEVAYYITQGILGVFGYIMCLYMRFWKCIVKV